MPGKNNKKIHPRLVRRRRPLFQHATLRMDRQSVLANLAGTVSPEAEPQPEDSLTFAEAPLFLTPPRRTARGSAGPQRPTDSGRRTPKPPRLPPPPVPTRSLRAQPLPPSAAPPVPPRPPAGDIRPRQPSPQPSRPAPPPSSMPIPWLLPEPVPCYHLAVLETACAIDEAPAPVRRRGLWSRLWRWLFG